MISIKVNDKIVHKTQNKKEAFSAIKQLFARGQKEVYMYGVRIGSWR